MSAQEGHPVAKNRKKAKSFDIQEFLSSAGKSRRILKFKKGQVIFSQDEQETQESRRAIQNLLNGRKLNEGIRRARGKSGRTRAFLGHVLARSVRSAVPSIAFLPAQQRMLWDSR